MMNRSLTILGTTVLLLAACGRSGPPAPVEIVGVGNGETRPGMASANTYSANTPPAVMGGTYTPPPGYGGTPAAAPVGAIQAQALPEPNDPYAQAATLAPVSTMTIPSNVVMNPPPPNFANNGAVIASQPGQPQVLGVLPVQNQYQPPVAQPPVTQPQAVAPVVVPPPAPVAAITAPAAVDQGTGTYGWPIRGRLISGFGPKDGGQANDGLNIAAPLGNPVYASKEGTVAYAGNELRSFGNMVLVRHAGGMFTVYAHLDQISVEKNATVTKGQMVGTVGQSGGVAEPQLHFEVRKGSVPQDPMKYLGR